LAQSLVSSGQTAKEQRKLLGNETGED